jgi:hypothetical protein
MGNFKNYFGLNNEFIDSPSLQSIFRKQEEVKRIEAQRQQQILEVAIMNRKYSPFGVYFKSIPLRPMTAILENKDEPRDDWRDDQWWADYHEALRSLS